MSYIVSDKDDYETFDNDDSESNYDFEDWQPSFFISTPVCLTAKITAFATEF